MRRGCRPCLPRFVTRSLRCPPLGLDQRRIVLAYAMRRLARVSRTALPAALPSDRLERTGSAPSRSRTTPPGVYEHSSRLWRYLWLPWELSLTPRRLRHTGLTAAVQAGSSSRSSPAGRSVGVLFPYLQIWSGRSVTRTASSSTFRSACPKALRVELVIGMRGAGSVVEAAAFFRRQLAKLSESTRSRTPIAQVEPSLAREFRGRRSRSCRRFARSIRRSDGVRKLADLSARFIRRCASGRSLAKRP